jgi:undecaprenyl pyrophosphate phosphatase UppP
MNTLQAFLIAILEGLTEYLPISSTAHMVFSVRILNSRRRFCQTFQGFYSIRRYSGRCCFVLEKIFRFLHPSVASVLPQTYLRSNSGFDFRQII